MRSLLFVMVLLLGACGSEDVEVKSTQYVFGTLVDFTVRGLPKDEAEAVIAEIGRDFQKMHVDWHAWKPGGALMGLNTAIKAGRETEVTPGLIPLLHQARDFARLSGGLFDPAIGKLIALWGFHADELPKGARPDAASIEALVKSRPSVLDLRIEGNKVSSTNADVSLDFGGFAKGSALDLAMATLKARGIAHAIINAGGDLNTLGDAGGRPWRVAIRDPKKKNAAVAWLELEGGENLYTSGDYERFRDDDGTRWGHIIDPRTGWPTRNFVSVTVLHANGALADAAATALTVAGADWPKVAKAMGIDQAFLLDEHDKGFATPKMAGRLNLDPSHPVKVTVVELP